MSLKKFVPYIISHSRWPPRTELLSVTSLYSLSFEGCYMFPGSTLGFLQGKALSPKETDLFLLFAAIFFLLAWWNPARSLGDGGPWSLPVERGKSSCHDGGQLGQDGRFWRVTEITFLFSSFWKSLCPCGRKTDGGAAEKASVCRAWEGILTLNHSNE